MPVLALRGITVFPNMMIHLDVAREASVNALDEAMSTGKSIFLVAQRDMTQEHPDQDDLFKFGTIATVRQILRLPENSLRVMVDGEARGKLVRLVFKEPFLSAEVEKIPSESTKKNNSSRTEAQIRQAFALLERYTELSDRVTSDTYLKVVASDDPGYIADFIAQNLPLRYEDKQVILEELRPVPRLGKLLRILSRELEILELENELAENMHEHMIQGQREYYLREQMRAIQQELGESGDDDNEINEYREKIALAKLPDEVRKKLEKELSHLEKQPFGSAEGGVIRMYLDTCLELPWMKKTKERVSVSAVRKVLNEDHYGLENVKTRILEFIAVKQMAPDLKGQILCLVGPPGVGKTSIAISVAKAMNRNLARISLGGIHDEAEIRGHRKTYVGAMPGRIIMAVKNADSSNPLMLLDEIDKVGSDMRGDPASALLEVLDGEQNKAFVDHYLEVPFDLSDVMFITTANTTDTIPRPLLDRMEVIELTSYTDEEKLMIAKLHLLPKQLGRHGLKKSQLKISDNGIRKVISSYTRESGVRQLEQQLASLCRKTAMSIVDSSVKQVRITGENLDQYLGAPKYYPEKLSDQELVGVVNGLAWTSAGGEILEVEVNAVPGSGKLELTGNLGDIMKESVYAAVSYIRSRCSQLGINPNFYKETDIHVHFPEASVPKDGPSAGITITTAIVSALTGQTVRRNIAMTGEITLRGRVLPIGGLKEKTMAALRNGITTVIIPSDNVKDLEEIDQTVRAALHFVAVEHIDQVISEALHSPESFSADEVLCSPKETLNPVRQAVSSLCQS